MFARIKCITLAYSAYFPRYLSKSSTLLLTIIGIIFEFKTSCIIATVTFSHGAKPKSLGIVNLSPRTVINSAAPGPGDLSVMGFSLLQGALAMVYLGPGGVAFRFTAAVMGPGLCFKKDGWEHDARSLGKLMPVENTTKTDEISIGRR